MKRSSASPYIALGVILLILVGLLIWANSIGGIKNDEPAWQPGNYYMQECMEQAADRILFDLGMTGARLTEEILFTSYLIKDGQNLLPELNDVRLMMADYLDKSIDECAEGYSLPEKIEKNRPEFSILFGQKQTIITISEPYKIIKGEMVHAPSSMVITRDVRFLTMYTSVSQIIEDRLSSGYIVESQGLNQSDYVVEVLDQGLYELWGITDYDSFIEKEPYRFVFAFSVER